MMVRGMDCSLVVKTAHWETDIPYSSETVREELSMLREEAPIEGDGICRAIRKVAGITGCVVTPLTMGTAPLLLYLAMGRAEPPLFVSGTRNLYRTRLYLLPTEDMEAFEVIQDRGGERRRYEGCAVKAFEVRMSREALIKVKLDFLGESAPAVYPYSGVWKGDHGERFSGDGVTYTINGREQKNIYGVTFCSNKEGGIQSELWIHRTLEKGTELPPVIEEMTITALLRRDSYEANRYGTFRITLYNLVMVSDETDVDCAGAVIGPLRYYVSGNVFVDVYSSGEVL